MMGEKSYILFEGNLRQVLCENGKSVTIVNNGRTLEVPLAECKFISLSEFFRK